LQSGTLLEILQPFRSKPMDITALYLHRKFKPAKVKAFVDFLDSWFTQHGLCPTHDPGVLSAHTQNRNVG
jgi:DNA-binding transcriptional LysR family regulator